MSAGAIVGLVFIGWAVIVSIIFWLYVKYFGGSNA